MTFGKPGFGARLTTHLLHIILKLRHQILLKTFLSLLTACTMFRVSSMRPCCVPQLELRIPFVPCPQVCTCQKVSDTPPLGGLFPLSTLLLLGPLVLLLALLLAIAIGLPLGLVLLITLGLALAIGFGLLLPSGLSFPS